MQFFAYWYFSFDFVSFFFNSSGHFRVEVLMHSGNLPLLTAVYEFLDFGNLIFFFFFKSFFI